MKIKLELDLTPEEAKELFVPSDKQTEFGMMLYDAYVDAMRETVWKHVDPNNMMGFRKDK
jgi:hypothetical protein